MGKVELKLEIDAELFEAAKTCGVPLAAATEDGIRRALALQVQAQARAMDAGKAKKWAEDNAEAIADHKERIEQFGVFGEDLRTW